MVRGLDQARLRQGFDRARVLCTGQESDLGPVRQGLGQRYLLEPRQRMFGQEAKKIFPIVF